MPKTMSGKVAVWCMILFFSFLFIGILVLASGQRAGEALFENLYIDIPMLSAGFFAVLGFFVGLYSIIRRKERSILVILATLFGFLVTFMLAGELLGPKH